jgi:hypothetical protein
MGTVPQYREAQDREYGVRIAGIEEGTVPKYRGVRLPRIPGREADVDAFW